jgi:hypothetical protein
MIKKPSERKKTNPAAVKALADTLADKPYGEDKKVQDAIVNTSISLPASLLRKMEDLAITNKREKKDGPKNISAIVRAGLELYLKGKQ